MNSFPSAFLICSFVFPIFIHQLCIKILNLFCPKILENSQVTPSITVAVMFTFSFGSAFAGTFEAKTSEDKAALITVAQTELAASKDYLDTVKAYYLKNFTDISLTDDYLGVTVKKAAVEKIIDDVFKAITKEVTAAYNNVIIAINQGSVTTDGDEPTLADAKDAVKAAVKSAYTEYNADAIEFEAVPTAEEYDKFWGKDETEEAVAKYAAKLVASLVEKIADYGQDKFEKDYDLDTKDFVDNLLETYMVDAYTNDAIIAIKAPVTAADETAVLAVADRVADFYDYQELLGLHERQAYEYPVYDSLLNQYVEELEALAEEKLEDAYDAIQKGGITVEDEAAIAEYMADLKAALTNAKADAVEATIAKINASAKPLDLAAIKAAREAYDALGEVGIDNTMYHKLLSLENLAKAESIASVEALKLTASSTAKKGSVTVKWSVVGEADIDGYQIWKSTKANKSYKKVFTTTKKTYKNSKGLKKGTRYYYKVRAYKVIDGKNVYSDWSNKANRKAK